MKACDLAVNASKTERRAAFKGQLVAFISELKQWEGAASSGDGDNGLAFWARSSQTEIARIIASPLKEYRITLALPAPESAELTAIDVVKAENTVLRERVALCEREQWKAKKAMDGAQGWERAADSDAQAASLKAQLDTECADNVAMCAEIEALRESERSGQVAFAAAYTEIESLRAEIATQQAELAQWRASFGKVQVQADLNLGDTLSQIVDVGFEDHVEQDDFADFSGVRADWAEVESTPAVDAIHAQVAEMTACPF